MENDVKIQDHMEYRKWRIKNEDILYCCFQRQHQWEEYNDFCWDVYWEVTGGYTRR